jgi:glyoxylase-like metal-dependent hydrolase (beta-lactamase superfamily II)
MAKPTKVRLLDSGTLVIDQSHITWNIGCGTPVRFPVYSVLIEHPDGLIMFDTGYDIDVVNEFLPFELPEQTDQQVLPAQLELCGFKPDDVDVLVNSHLHFDHCGGNTSLDESGAVVPTFPNARYVAVRGEWEDASHPNERNRASYRPDNFLPLEGSGLLELVEPGAEVVPGLSFEPAPGHTRFHQCVRIQNRGQTALFCADLVPTAAHVPYPYIMAYDLYPLDTLATKKRILSRAAAEGWRLILEHEPGFPVGRIRLDEAGAPRWLPEA